MPGLQWARTDVGFYRNPKLLKLITDGKYRAVVVGHAAILHCVEQGTDGVVSRSVLPLIHGRPSDARDLVRVELWHPFGTDWIVNDYEEFQQLSGTTKAIREQKRVAAAKGNCSRYHEKGCRCWDPENPGPALKAVR